MSSKLWSFLYIISSVSYLPSLDWFLVPGSYGHHSNFLIHLSQSKVCPSTDKMSPLWIASLNYGLVTASFSLDSLRKGKAQSCCLLAFFADILIHLFHRCVKHPVKLPTTSLYACWGLRILIAIILSFRLIICILIVMIRHVSNIIIVSLFPGFPQYNKIYL